MANPTILIIEDEEAIIELLRYNLQAQGYQVVVEQDGGEAVFTVEEKKPDLILLDWMLPNMSGIEICRELRKSDVTQHIPIIMLTAKGEELDRVKGLELGADDYVIKPFSPNELLSRIKAVLRRSKPSLSKDVLSYKGLVMKTASYSVTYHETVVHLGPTEYRILQCLMEHPTRIFSREQLISQAWDHDSFIEPRTIDVHINRLRNALKKVSEADDMPLIKTIRSAGYCLQPSEHDG